MNLQKVVVHQNVAVNPYVCNEPYKCLEALKVVFVGDTTHCSVSFIFDNVYICRYSGRKLNEVDQKLLQIQLPNIINRNPRSITQRKFWKGEQRPTIHMYMYARI